MAAMGSGAFSAEEAEAPPLYVSPADAKAWAERPAGVVFLDVREADEFAAGHLPGARNIPHQAVDSLIPELPHDRPVVLYCIHSAHRAPAAARRLRERGFPNAYVMEGGIVAWQAGGQEIRANGLASVPAVLPKTDRCSAPMSPGPDAP